MRDTAITSQEIDTLYEQRGEVDCDGKNRHDNSFSWKDMSKLSARSGMARRAYLDAEKANRMEEM